jgi:hypothetical protein
MSTTLSPPPGPAPGAPQAPPGMMLNRAYAQWAQQQQKVQAIQAVNQQRQQQFEAAVALIKKDGMHGFRLDIEADSTIAPDEEAEKRSRIEFMQQFVPLMEQIVPIAQGNPPLASLAKEVTLFAMRGFRVARPLEETVEEAFDAIAQMPPNPKVSGAQGKGGTQQNPAVEQAKIAADVHDTQMKAQTDMAAIAQKQQAAQIQASMAAQRDATEDQHNQAQLALEAEKLAQTERLEQARVTRIGMQDAGALR